MFPCKRGLTLVSMLYSRQLWVYNFSIYNSSTGVAKMYLWKKAVNSRGADEICSCLKHYLQRLPPVCFWNHLHVLLEQSDQIDHKFSVRGHTYLPNYRDFVHIEKRKQNARVYVLADWEAVVRDAHPRTTFDVQPNHCSHFLDYCELTKQYTCRKKDTDKNLCLSAKQCRWTLERVKTPLECWKHLNEVWIKYTYSTDELRSKVTLLEGRKRLPPSSTCIYQYNTWMATQWKLKN